MNIVFIRVCVNSLGSSGINTCRRSCLRGYSLTLMPMGAGKQIPPRQTIFGKSGHVCVFLLEQEIQIEDA
ncbi:hypothetical protein DPMN_168255 [Dreissena polymorpha]|uniref:Uncharacterized protein n=1 Tax=Dreissena polymorpha TaxID=45954 RepID=A0A9D4F0B3_DREPO|nr:hypothetical protein DPMN_168255 [Dreissena polymorpha]